MPNSGKVNAVSLAIFVAVMAGFWWLFIFGPVYLDNLDVQDAVVSGFNQIRNHERDEQVRAVVVGQCNKQALGWHWEENMMGERRQEPGLGLTEENVHVDRDEARQIFRIYVDYTRDVRLWPSQKWRTITFHVEKAGAYDR